MGKDSSINIVYDSDNNIELYTYDNWTLLKRLNGALVRNLYIPSTRVAKQQSRLNKYLRSSNTVPYVSVHCPKGLDHIEALDSTKTWHIKLARDIGKKLASGKNKMIPVRNAEITELKNSMSKYKRLVLEGIIETAIIKRPKVVSDKGSKSRNRAEEKQHSYNPDHCTGTRSYPTNGDVKIIDVKTGLVKEYIDKGDARYFKWQKKNNFKDAIIF